MTTPADALLRTSTHAQHRVRGFRHKCVSGQEEFRP